MWIDIRRSICNNFPADPRDYKVWKLRHTLHAKKLGVQLLTAVDCLVAEKLKRL